MLRSLLQPCRLHPVRLRRTHCKLSQSHHSAIAARLAFDPRKLVPSERDQADAFLSLVGAVLAGSGATWLLGTDVSRLNTFDSLQAYESAVVAVTMGSPIAQGGVGAGADGALTGRW